VSRALILAGFAIAALVAAHIVVFGLVVRHLALPVAAAAGLVALVIAKHLGLLAPLAGWLRRRRSTPRS
jgi:hypothetical protein